MAAALRAAPQPTWTRAHFRWKAQTRLQQLANRLRTKFTIKPKILWEFPIARIGNGTVAHYVDDYRYQPGRTICGRMLTSTDQFLDQLDLPLCAICAKRKDRYPTEGEFREYHKCTDCGIDVWTAGETSYQLKYNIWELAYPGYSRGIGVGTSRPCIGCLETRLGRTLTPADFNHPKSPAPYNSDRLNQRITATADKVATTSDGQHAIDSRQIPKSN